MKKDQLRKTVKSLLNHFEKDLDVSLNRCDRVSIWLFDGGAVHVDCNDKSLRFRLDEKGVLRDD